MYFRSLGFEAISRDEVDPEVKSSLEFQGTCPRSAVVMHLMIPETPLVTCHLSTAAHSLL
ncbi:MAG TPA: hypothetical protein GX506_00695 [Firmicutes bacterium]|nr:hypothetical protein [Bacillota bacterium]